MDKMEIVAKPGTQLPIETKLTKSEVIDLLIDEMEKDLRTQIAVLEKQEEDAKRLQFSEISQLFSGAVAQIDFNDWRHNDGHSITVSVKVPKDGGRFLKDEISRLRSLKAEKERLRSVLSSLTHGKQQAKNVILKKFLEGTEEGRDVLAQIAAFKIGLQAKLLAGAVK